MSSPAFPEESAAAIPSTARTIGPAPRPAAGGIPVTEALIRALPKTDLHCHLDGSMRLSTILELARQQGVRLPAEDEAGLARAIHMGELCGSLEEYLVAFDVTLSVLQTADAIERAAYELAIDAWNEGVRYIEVRYSPILHQRQGLKLTQIVDAVLDGLRAAKREVGIESGVIICGIRNMDPQLSLRLAELAVAYKNHGVRGFDLAGAENEYPAKKHRAAFALVLENNVNCTCHAGEAYGPQSIAQAIHTCGAHRIGHGVRLREDGDLLNYVNDHRLPLECCPSSNVQTGAVKSLEEHPLKFYLDYGLRVTVNTDNRLITDTTVTRELLLAHQRCGLSLDDLITCVINGWKSAFLPFRAKQDRLRRVNAEIARLLDDARSGSAPTGSGPGAAV